MLPRAVVLGVLLERQVREVQVALELLLPRGAVTTAIRSGGQCRYLTAL